MDVRRVRRQRGASKWRCPTGECKPASVWLKADRLHTLIPRTTDRRKGLYHQRGAVEREFGRLKHEWAMLPLRVRRLTRVRLRVDLTVLAQLASVATCHPDTVETPVLHPATAGPSPCPDTEKRPLPARFGARRGPLIRH